VSLNFGNYSDFYWKSSILAFRDHIAAHTEANAYSKSNLLLYIGNLLSARDITIALFLGDSYQK
jgi:hypothetical protein